MFDSLGFQDFFEVDVFFGGGAFCEQHSFETKDTFAW